MATPTRNQKASRALYVHCQAYAAAQRYETLRDSGVRIPSGSCWKQCGLFCLARRFLRAARILGFLLLSIFEPAWNAFRWDRCSRRVRIDGAGCDDQPVVELHSRESLRFRFGLKRSGRPGASWPDHGAPPWYFEGNIPASSPLPTGLTLRGTNGRISVRVRAAAAARP
jgi:hypothetical protein